MEFRAQARARSDSGSTASSDDLPLAFGGRQEYLAVLFLTLLCGSVTNGRFSASVSAVSSLAFVLLKSHYLKPL